MARNPENASLDTPVSALILNMFSRGIVVACLLFSCTIIARADSHRGYDPDMLQLGKQMFQKNCAACHGMNAEGTVKNWQQRDAYGHFPPPPLNGTAHTWHHPLPWLMYTVQHGTLGNGGSMPAWKDTLADEEIFAILVWLTSLWPDEIFEAWRERHQQ